MNEECDHDIIVSRCSKCGQSAKVILLHTFAEGMLAECESSAVQLGTGWYVALEKLRKLLRRWDELYGT